MACIPRILPCVLTRCQPWSVRQRVSSGCTSPRPCYMLHTPSGVDACVTCCHNACEVLLQVLHRQLQGREWQQHEKVWLDVRSHRLICVELTEQRCIKLQNAIVFALHFHSTIIMNHTIVTHNHHWEKVYKGKVTWQRHIFFPSRRIIQSRVGALQCTHVKELLLLPPSSPPLLPSPVAALWLLSHPPSQTFYLPKSYTPFCPIIMFGQKAFSLLEEIDRSDRGIPPYRDALVREVCDEVNELCKGLQQNDVSTPASDQVCVAQQACPETHGVDLLPPPSF
jgi:hypothetical protein